MYRNYVADSLVFLTDGSRRYYTKRYDEILHPVPVDNRTGQEMADDIIERIGLTIEDEDEDDECI